jgi:tetratricopeptide (TPR) repeat protein
MSTSDLEPLFQQARAAVRRHEYPAAIELYRQAIDADNTSLEAIEGLAMVLCAANDYPGAAEQFQRLTFLQPMVARHYVNLGAVYNRQGQHQQAVDVLRKAVSRDRKCADGYYNLGVAQRKLNQSSMAMSSFKEAIRLDPQLAEAYQNLANIYVDLGNLNLAIVNFKKALEIRPDFDKARAGLEKAEDAAQQAKASANPFGRLVETSAIAPKSVPTLTRELTETERLVDRRKVRELSGELETLSEQYSEFCKSKLEPSLIELQKTVADGEFKSLTFLNSASEFQETFAQWIALRQQLKRKTLELRAHEELVNTPGLPIV